MWFPVYPAAEPVTQSLYLPFGQRFRLSVKPHEPHDTGDLKNWQAVVQWKANEHISRKQRHLQLHPPVFPAAHGFIQWQEMFDRSVFELFRNALFAVCTRVNNVPVW